MRQPTTATKTVNFLVGDAALRADTVGPVVGLTGAMTPVALVLAVYRKRYGGLWVGGRATLTADSVTLGANAVNRLVHQHLEPLTVPLTDVQTIEVVWGFVTNIVVPRAKNDAVTFRCYGAAAFADLIRANCDLA